MKIGNFDLERDGVYIIAELSANHNGSLAVAKQTIQAAYEAGANAIKLQTYRADTITLQSDKKDFIIGGGTLWDGKSLYELYDWAHTPWEWHEELFTYAKKIGIQIFSSPFDKSAVDFLKRFDPPAYKIASFEITDGELIRYCAKEQKPLIISTGIATKEEIAAAVQICKSEVAPFVLLQCTSSYPAPLEHANLVTMQDMAKRFECSVGFSDHTLGITAPVAAVSLGAKVIEKHFILDKSVGGADSAFSLDKNEFSQMVQSVRACEKLLGKVCYNDKTKSSRRFARSLYASQPIKKGEIFSEQNVKSVRPGYGLHPKYFAKITGEKAQKDFESGDRIVIEGLDATYED
jgi:pseudaminic acid synthase